MTPEPYEEAYTAYIRRRHPLRALLADWRRLLQQAPAR